eukprot:757687-Hanusia_phi.AAC.1
MKWTFVAGIVGDVVVLGGGSYAMHKYPPVRIVVGEIFPPLQDTYYIILHNYGGKDQVLSARDADVEAAAQMYLQTRHARCSLDTARAGS